MTQFFTDMNMHDQKKTDRKGRKAIALAMALTLFTGGCAVSAIKDEQNTGSEETQETAVMDTSIDSIVSKIEEGKIKKAIESANMARITAKTDHSLDEETIAVLDSLYAYCQIVRYLENDDITAAKPWVEKLDAGVLPEPVRALWEKLYTEYQDRF